MSSSFNDDHQIETYKSMITISIEAFKYLALLNGGAAAGMLAAFDRLMAVMPMRALKIALCCFICGLVLDGMAVACSYLTQYALFNEGFQRAKDRKHVLFLRIAIASCVCGLFTFCVGAATAVFSAHLPSH
jgi:hypothetical protein